MKLIDPRKIKVGQIYFQDMGHIKLIKKRINKENRKEEIWGTYIKTSSNGFKVGDEGFVSIDSKDCKFYLLSDKELGELFLELL